MTEIDWPDSVIEAGVDVYIKTFDPELYHPVFLSGVIKNIFTAMATALVKHDREASLRTPTFEGPIVADMERQWHGGVHIWQEPKPEVKHDREQLGGGLGGDPAQVKLDDTGIERQFVG